MRGIKYEFSIDSFTPETLPAARLAAYLTELTVLLGSMEGVHFERVAEGSAVQILWVDEDVDEEVASRVTAVESHQAPEEARKAFGHLNQMLRQDRGIAHLTRHPSAESLDRQPQLAVVLRFPGREVPEPAVVGPLTQAGSLQGQLIRIGGKDKTAHAQLQDGEKVWNCTLTRALARDIAGYLFGQTLRIFGTGRWKREANGEWQCSSFLASSFETLDDAPLGEVVARLQAVTGSGWQEMDDSYAAWQELRGNDGDK